MAMGNKNSPNLIGIALYKGKIRQNQIHPQHVSIRESHTAVNDNHIPFTFKQCEVLADFIKTTQKINPQGRLFHLLLFLPFP